MTADITDNTRRTILAAALCGCLAAAGAAADDLENGVRAFHEERYAAAARYWRPLAQAGGAQAQIFMATLYRYGLGVKTDPAKAAAWYEKAALQGEVDAQGEIGFFYELGLGVPQDAAAAERWYDMVRERGLCLADTNPTGRLNYRP